MVETESHLTLRAERVQPMALGWFCNLQSGTADVRPTSSWESGRWGDVLDATFLGMAPRFLGNTPELWDQEKAYLAIKKIYIQSKKFLKKREK